ncbi:ABC transporter ATP-binding protein [Kitasatospora purpeofusca]|uniref:ABC transporter ATP-binding protein n=1 Tax=Kitasatospora purpeofusca TaxID=67352 RepID=UPI0032488358
MTNTGGYEERDVVVRLTDVRKDFGDYAALDGVSLTIGAGESVAVMGPSGSGKSTLLNMVSGLDRPTGGSVVVGGEDLVGLDEKGLALFRRRRVGMIFQFFNLLDDLPALDNIALSGQLVGLKAPVARKRALELMDELGIADRRNVYPASLSGGERQRVATARALMNRPALLLADEPTGALDSRSGDQVMQLLMDLNRLGQTLLVVTHDPRLAARCARRVVEVADGRIARDSPVNGAAVAGDTAVTAVTGDAAKAADAAVTGVAR